MIKRLWNVISYLVVPMLALIYFLTTPFSEFKDILFGFGREFFDTFKYFLIIGFLILVFIWIIRYILTGNKSIKL